MVGERDTSAFVDELVKAWNILELSMLLLSNLTCRVPTCTVGSHGLLLFLFLLVLLPNGTYLSHRYFQCFSEHPSLGQGGG